MSSFFAHSHRTAVVLPFITALSLAMNESVQARSLVGSPVSGVTSGASGTASTAPGAQTATAATTAAAQAAQAAVTARRAQDSLTKSTAAFQSLAAAQAAAHLAAINNPSNIITSNDGTLTDGLGAGLLNPLGGVTAPQTASAIQLIDLGQSGKNQIVLSNGGSVTLPSGTTGSDQVKVSGSGTVTTTSGTVSTGAGSLTTSTGGTLATTATTGGTISLTAGSGTLSATTASTISSTLAGTITLPASAGGGTVTLAANQATTVPAGSTVSFSGSGAGTVTVSGAGTVQLSGAGTLALANAAAGTGGTISTNSGITTFTNGATSSEAPGSTISLSGSGSIDFTGAGNDILPVIVQPSAATQTLPAFTTTGSLLSTTSYNIPASWSLGAGGALSQSVDGGNGQTTVTVTQTQQEALLYWTSFNIGKNTTLDFDQSAGGANVGNWIAVNRILDPSLAPSQILGSIVAPGQVYVINQNGIIFNGSSQINTHALVASTLPINDNLVSSGLLNNTSGQFLFTNNSVTVVSSTAGDSTVTLSSANLPTGFGVGSAFLGSTVASINGNVVTLAGAAATTDANQPETFSNSVTVVSSAVGSHTVTISDPNATPPPGFGAGATLLGSTVQSIVSNGDGTDTVTLTGNANLPVTNQAETYSPGGQLSVVSSSTSSKTVTLASSTLPLGFGVGSTLLGSTVQKVNGNTVTLASNAASADSNQSETFADTITVTSSLLNSNMVVLGSAALPPGFGVGSAFLGSKVQSINGNVVTLVSNASVSDTNQSEGYTTASSIIVQPGANLFSPGSAEGVGGKIALIAPTVDNEGTISSPDGQIILAAGQQIAFESHPNPDPSLRGLDVAIGLADGTETVTNGVNGYIYAPEADVTMTAPTINQNGTIQSLTSVSLNGRIDLLAVSGLAFDLNDSNFDTDGASATPLGGTINLGPNSLTEILPDYASTDTAVGSSLALPSQVYVAGSTLHLQGNATSGAQLFAPNATVTLSLGILNTPIAATAGVAANTGPLPENTGVASSGPVPPIQPFFLATEGSLVLDQNANLDVSGSNVQASVTENILQVDLTQAVLENSPLQVNGALRGQTVSVDISQTGTNADGSIWYGSPIGDLSGYANLVDHTVGELTIAGGSVAINTNGSVKASASSTVNVSGGSINYQGANVQTTVVVTSDGQRIDISKATSNLTYVGIDSGSSVSSSKWGYNQSYGDTFRSGTLYDTGYVTGGSGGSLNISTQSASLNGSLYGNTTSGVRQQLTPPASSSLNLTFLSIINGANANPVNVVIQPTMDVQSDPNAVYLSPDLFGADGFSNATINAIGMTSGPVTAASSSTITVSADTTLATAAGGSLNFKAENITIDGHIVVPSGTINFNAQATDPLDQTQGIATDYNSAIGNINVASGATIATTGLVFDESSGVISPLPISVNGGGVTLNGAVVSLAAGSTVDASGGAVRNGVGKVVSGKGGSIKLTGVYLGVNGQLILNGNLSAYGVGTGGSLSLSTTGVQVGGDPAQINLNTLTPLELSPDFFSQGGFSSFTVTGAVGLQILSSITPVLTEEIATSGQQFGLGLISASQLPQYPAAPVNLNFAVPTSGTGEVVLGAGTTITTGATGSVSLTGASVDILGSITAPGGTITVKGDSTTQLGGDQAGQTIPPDISVYIGSGATLSVSGVAITTPVASGYQVYNTGQVLNGGTISITGNIVGDANASLQADGATGALDVPLASAGGSATATDFQAALNPYVHETVSSNGGSITLNGLEELVYTGRVSAHAGDTTAIGGTLTVASGLATSYTPPPNAGYPEIFITPNVIFSRQSVTLGQPLTESVEALLGTPLAGSPTLGTGGALFSVKQFDEGGFGSLILDGNVEFAHGNSAVPIVITASQKVEIVSDSLNGTVFTDGSSEAISINAPYIAIGATSLSFNGGSAVVDSNAPLYVGTSTTVTTTTLNPSTNTFTTSSSAEIQRASPVPGLADPTYGGATIALNATDLIDVGFLSLQGFGTTTLSVPTGDIRGGGLLYASGHLNLAAGQVYTSTATTFTVAAFDAVNSAGAPVAGSVDITNPLGISRSLPLSAGGTINVYATDIVQDGTIEAPFGTINLGALPDASGQLPVLAGVTQTLDPSTELYDTAPDYSQHAPTTQSLTIGAGSVTSVSGVSSTGVALELPYGTIENGNQWIAPNGANITAGGLPAKAVNLKAENVNVQTGSLIDLAGGGDLFAYQFVPGVGGTNDVLSIYKYAAGAIVVSNSNVPVASTNFAILPSYGLDYAPIDLTVDSNVTYPYANAASTNQVGSQVYLAGGDGLAAGTYTILPARYALLPGAYLVTPISGSTPSQTSLNPDQSINMAGQLYNDLSPAEQGFNAVTGYQLASSAIVHTRAEYDIFGADAFLKSSAIANNQSVPLLPMDAGQLLFSATQALELQQGTTVLGNAAPGTAGLGSQVDISSSDNIEINDTGTDASFDGLVLDATNLTGIGADSLLIGGYRQTTTSGTVVNVTTSDLVIANTSAATLSADDVILVSNGTLNVSSTAAIASTGSNTAQNLSVVNAGTGAVSVAASSTGSNTVTLSSATLPSSFGVGSTLLGSTVQSINGTTVTLAGNANATVANPQFETFAGNVLGIASSSTTSNVVTLSSATLPASFGVGSKLLGSTVQSINGTTVTLAGNANANVSNLLSETYSSSDGVLLRINGDASATTARNAGVSLTDTNPSVFVAAGATISGAALTIDSTQQAELDATPVINAISISAGRVSIEVDPNEVMQPNPGLVLSATTLATLQANAQSLSLSSYSSIDFYGSGIIGGAPVDGVYPVGSLTLDAAEIRGFSTVGGVNAGGGTVVINAENATLNDAINGAAPGAVAGISPSGSLAINAGNLQLGPGGVMTTGYASTNLSGSKAITLSGTGGLTTQGGLVLATPLLTAVNAVSASGTTTATSYAFTAQSGMLQLTEPTVTGTPTVTSGRGATISLTGPSVSLASEIYAPSGTINVTATTGDVKVQAGGNLKASGQAVTFGNTMAYSNGGQVNLKSTGGNVSLDANSVVNVSAPSAGGNAGTLAVSAPSGIFTVADGTLQASAGANGAGGIFNATLGQAPTLSGVTTPLADGGFTSLAFDVLTGSVTVDGAVGPAFGQNGLTSFSLTTEQGGITVANTINASGLVGGTIDLYANQDVTLTPTAVLTVEAQEFNNAGQGGVVDIETRGAGVNGIDIQGGSKINLAVDHLPVLLPQVAANQTGASITLAQAGSFVLPSGTPGDDQLMVNSAGTITTAAGVTTTFDGTTPLTGIKAGSTITLTSPGTVTLVAGSTGGTVPVLLSSSANFTSSGATNLNGNAALTAANAGDASGTLHLRAPTTSGNTSLAVVPFDVNGIVGASSVVLEGYNVYDTSQSSTAGQSAATGQINAALEAQVQSDAASFASATNTNTILNSLLGSPSAAQLGIYQVTPGAEITNPTGDLTLASNWDLSSFRFGPTNNVAGVLTLRAAGNLNFTGSLTDGFAFNFADNENVAASPYTWDLITGPTWSYRLVAGAQFTAANTSTANFGAVQSVSQLGTVTSSLTGTSVQNGSLFLGKIIPNGIRLGTQTATIANTYAQIIRTGTGSITIDTGGNVDLMNQLASIYTAGTLSPAIASLANFASPVSSTTETSEVTYEKTVYGSVVYPDYTARATTVIQYLPQYTESGGSISINAQQDIAHLTLDADGDLVADTSWQFPTNWLYRRGASSSPGVFDQTSFAGRRGTSVTASTTWWVDFSNFFEGIGALGGGNVTVTAGRDIVNVDAVDATNARMPATDTASNLVELGGGNLSVTAVGTIVGGSYYVEQGVGTINAGSITSAGDTVRVPGFDVFNGITNTPLALTLFVGNSSFSVNATNELSLGSTVNPFLLPQGIGNGFTDASVFSTYGANSSVSLSSLLGSVAIQGSLYQGTSLPGSLFDAYFSNGTDITGNGPAVPGPWALTLNPSVEAGSNTNDTISTFETDFSLSPPILKSVAFAGNIQYNSDVTLYPSSGGTLQALAAGSVDGAFNSSAVTGGTGVATITILDDDPSKLPGVTNPVGLGLLTPETLPTYPSIAFPLAAASALVGETPSFENSSSQVLGVPALDAQHTVGLLHANAAATVAIDTISGDIGDLTLVSPEAVNISSGLDLQDVGLYIQNNNANDVSVVSANRDITLYDPTSTRLVDLNAANAYYTATGDVQVSGPGTLEVLAGRNLALGQGIPDFVTHNFPGTGGNGGLALGITSIGNSRDPYLPFAGADIIASAGLGGNAGLDVSQLAYGNVNYTNGMVAPNNPTSYASSFVAQFLDPNSGESARYLPDLAAFMGLPGSDSSAQIWAAFSQQSTAKQDTLATDVFYDVLRDSGRDHNSGTSPFVGTYAEGFAAISALFPSSNSYTGNISLTAREIKTTNVGDINLLAPGGGVDLGTANPLANAADQGILTVSGGNISIFTNNDVSVGTLRIFTLHGGDLVIWSTAGNIDAGASSRTVQSAPPTRVLVDTASANVQTDLAGLATGGGIGVLETVAGAPPGNVDLIAPVGTVNAGDAGIRASGNVNIAAARVLNAGNIQAGGSTSGVPTTSVPNISSSVAASSAAGGAQNAANATANHQQQSNQSQEDLPSIISVEVIGYGGGDDASDEPKKDTDATKATYVADRP